MTIDELIQALGQRLDRATALHIELDQETSARFAETDKRFQEIAARFAETLLSINQLAAIATAHKQRPDDLEGQS